MSLIAAYDLSLNSSGVCILEIESGSPVHYESISSRVSGIDRLYYNYTRYLALFTLYKEISIIAFEQQNAQMRFSYSAGSILSLAENVGVWKLALYQSLPQFKDSPLVVGVSAQDIKKFATSNGKATKEEMIAAVNGHHIKTIRREIPEQSINDVADAYHLARLVRSLNESKELLKYVVADYRYLNFYKIPPNVET